MTFTGSFSYIRSSRGRNYLQIKSNQEIIEQKAKTEIIIHSNTQSKKLSSEQRS